MHLVRKLATLRRLGGLRRSLLIEAALLPIAIGISFRLVGVPRTQAMLRRWTETRTTAGSSDLVLAARSAQKMIKRNTGIGGKCLVRALTLWSMLRRRGIETDLRVGFRKKNGEIEGHAWIEYQGIPVNEPEAQTYIPHEGPFNFDLKLVR